MKNNTNIYDIDGELIRQAGDNHQFTMEEVQKKVQNYQDKLKILSEKENPTEEDTKLAAVYQTYIRNLMKYQLDLMSKMSQEEFTEYLTKNMPKTTSEQVEKALNDLKNDTETGESTEDEVSGSVTEDNESVGDEESGDDQAEQWVVGHVHEERPITQDSLLVERDDVKPTSMDEYVSPIGEAFDEYAEFEEK